MKNTVNENLEVIRNSEQFIEINGVLPLDQVEDLIINMVVIKTKNFGDNEDYPSEVEKIAAIFK